MHKISEWRTLTLVVKYSHFTTEKTHWNHHGFNWNQLLPLYSSRNFYEKLSLSMKSWVRKPWWVKMLPHKLNAFHCCIQHMPSLWTVTRSHNLKLCCNRIVLLFTWSTWTKVHHHFSWKQCFYFWKTTIPNYLLLTDKFYFMNRFGKDKFMWYRKRVW